MRPLGRAVLVSTTLASALVVTGCSDPKAADLCTQYKQVSARADEIKSLKPSSQTVNDLRHDLATFQASLYQLQAAGDGRLDKVISDLRAAVQDFVQAAVDNGKAASQTAQPLLEDSLSEVGKQWGLLQEQADAECGVS
jgi:hypothetical protein